MFNSAPPKPLSLQRRRKPKFQVHPPTQFSLSFLDSHQHFAAGSQPAPRTKTQPRLQSTSPAPLFANQVIRGHLSAAHQDGRSNWIQTYRLSNLVAGQQIHIEVKVPPQQANVDLRLLNGRQTVLLSGSGSIPEFAGLTFVTRPNMTYSLEVLGQPDDSSLQSLQYRLKTTSTPIVSSSDFNFFAGYGLVNAAAAVSKAIHQDPFVNPASGTASPQLRLIQAPAVWSQGFTGQGVTVAVIDSGIDFNHPDLAGNIDRVRGQDFVNSTNQPIDQDGHGTQVAGIVAGNTDGSGITGAAPSAKILPLRVFPDQVPTDYPGTSAQYWKRVFDPTLAAAIRYAVRKGVRVLQISLGNNPTDPPLPKTRAALQATVAAGVIPVMAAGNERQTYGATHPIEPAFDALQGLGIAVGAVNSQAVVARFSNPAGSQPFSFVVAPGVNVRSTAPLNQGGYKTSSGTSWAAPFVSGVVALMLSANPSLTCAEVCQILTSTADRQDVITEA